MKEELKRELNEINNKASHLDIPNVGNFVLEDIIDKATNLLSKVDLASSSSNDLEDFAQVYWIKARALNNLNRYEEAFNSYSKSYEIIKKCNGDFNLIELKSLYGLAWAAARLTRYEQSMPFCNKFIDLAIKRKCLFVFKDIYVVRGVCNKELGNSLKSQKDFHIANSDLAKLFEQNGREMEFNF